MFNFLKNKKVESIGNYKAPDNNFVIDQATNQQATDGASNVYLLTSGKTKMSVIKALREINPRLNLRAAKDIADDGGLVISTNYDQAQVAKEKLESVGATLEIR